MNRFQKFWNEKWKKNSNRAWPTNFSVKAQSFLEEYYGLRQLDILDLWSWGWRDSLYFVMKSQKVTAMDFSQNALNTIEKLDSSINCICCDFLNHDFWKEKYNVVYSSCSLHYFSSDNFKLIIKKIFWALKYDWVLLMRVKDNSNLKAPEWRELSKNYFTNWEDYKYRFKEEDFFDFFWCFWKVSVDQVVENHQLLAGWEKLQKYFDVIVIK